jgi:ABC-2 type transport system permease protein
VSAIYRATWVVAYRELLSFVSDRSRIVASVTFPLLFLAIFGGGFANIIGPMAGGVDLWQFMYPGIIAQSVVFAALFAGTSVVTDRETGFLREVLVSPMSRSGIVLGKAVGAAGQAILEIVPLLLLAPLVGVRLDVAVLVRLVPIVIGLSFALSGLGILIASFAPSQAGYSLMMQALVFPLVFLAGVFFPVDSVPAWMAVLSKANPVTYGVDAIRQVFLGSGPAASGLGVTVLGHTMALAEEATAIGVLGVVLLAAAIWAFSREEA